MRKIIPAFFILLVMLLSSISAHAVQANNVQVVSNGDTTFLIESNGTVKGWGRNYKGEVGNGTMVDQHTPVTIEGLSNIKEIIPNDYGYGYFYAIDTAGQAYSWGYNGYGQLGLGNTSNQLTPLRIGNLPEVSQIILNEYTTYALTPNGDLYAWGKNDYGQVGNNNKTNQVTPIKILSNVTSLRCKAGVAFAITEDKNVYAWGRGNDFQMGNGDVITAQTTPIRITALSNVDEVVTNGIASFAICDNRQEVYSWGEGWRDELGTYAERNEIPKRIWILSDLNETIDELIIDQNTAFAITSDNTLYGWGSNGYNELGNGSTYDQGTPKPITNIPKVNQFIFNGYSGVLLGVDGCVYTWGKNPYGEVGSGDQYRQRHAEKLTRLGNNVVQIYNGHNAMYAKDANGIMYGWGTNNLGQLAIGNTVRIVTPTIISELKDIVDIEKANNTVLVADAQGIIYGWGENDYGQLGDGTITTAILPLVISNNEITTTLGTGEVSVTVPIVGSINALEISITHPANISYSINPNTDEGFYCTDIQIQNNSKVPIKITIESFSVSNDNEISFEDVLPDTKDWNSLNTNDTKSYIALGLRYIDEAEWLISQVEFNYPLFAIEIDNTYVGALARFSSASLGLYGKHGLAFDGNYSAKHDLVFIVSLL